VPTLVTPPSEEPVSLAEARLHLYQPHTSQDTVISALIAAARRKCEKHLSTTFITSTWDHTFDSFPGWNCASQSSQLLIPNPPLISVTSLNYLDGSGSSQLLATSGYTVTTGLYGRIDPAYGTTWPTYRTQPGAVTIRYVAGYGAAASVPATIKAAILLYVGYLFVNRGDEDAPIPRAIADLLDAEARGMYV
jgi:uncharacterized phiE125 gp8 family phage protein